MDSCVRILVVCAPFTCDLHYVFFIPLMYIYISWEKPVD